MMLENVNDVYIYIYLLQTCDPIGFDIFFSGGKNIETNDPRLILRPNNQEDEQIIASLTQDLQKLRKATVEMATMDIKLGMM